MKVVLLDEDRSKPPRRGLVGSLLGWLGAGGSPAQAGTEGKIVLRAASESSAHAISRTGPRTSPEPRPWSVDCGRKQVLVVDDDPVIRMTTSVRLRSAGYDVTCASDCAEAIGAVATIKPQVILLDLHFPPDVANGGRMDWDGLRLMLWLRGLQNTARSRYIIITGKPSDEVREKARRGGASDFFEKPIDFDRLVSVIDKETSGEAPAPRPAPWWYSLFGFI